MDTDKLQAIQNVVDRVSSYQDGAPEGTVERELHAGLEEIGAEISDEEVRALADAVEARAGDVSAADVLG